MRRNEFSNFILIALLSSINGFMFSCLRNYIVIITLFY